MEGTKFLVSSLAAIFIDEEMQNNSNMTRDTFILASRIFPSIHEEEEEGDGEGEEEERM